MRTHDVWKSGLVRRWHSNPDMAHTAQTNAQHQWGCAILALSLWPDDHQLMIAALTHDVGEVGVGDVSAVAKLGSWALTDAINAAEKLSFERLDLPQPGWSRRLNLIDRLEAYLWTAQRAPQLLSGDGWPKAQHYILAEADRTDVFLEVSAIINGCNNEH